MFLFCLDGLRLGVGSMFGRLVLKVVMFVFGNQCNFVDFHCFVGSNENFVSVIDRA